MIKCKITFFCKFVKYSGSVLIVIIFSTIHVLTEWPPTSHNALPLGFQTLVFLKISLVKKRSRFQEETFHHPLSWVQNLGWEFILKNSVLCIIQCTADIILTWIFLFLSEVTLSCLYLWNANKENYFLSNVRLRTMFH